MEFKNLFPDVLYHSYIVEGEPTSTSFTLCEFLKNKEGDQIEILCQNYDSFNISDSELIKEWHSHKSVDENKRMCIIATKFINHEAERTLLKMIEEPALNTHFFIIVPNSKVLLDTIRSRTHIIKFTQVNLVGNHTGLACDEDHVEKEAKNFLKAPLKDKFEFIEKLVKSHKDEDLDSGGLRYHAIGLLNEIEKDIYTKWQKNKTDKNLINILEEVTEKRNYLNTPGASVKMILEHIAIMLE